MRTQATAALLLANAVVGLLPNAARGDVFLLHTGGQIQGEWLNRGQGNAVAYAIRLASGGQLTIAKERVAEVVGQSPSQAEYARLAPTCADTLDGQWSLAEWCRERNLRAERETHLRRMLELDPDHVQARLALGYMHVGGQWVTQEGRLQEQGYEWYRGRWRVIQEIELLETRQKRRQAETAWLDRLKRLREGLSGKTAAKAYEQIAAIRDPHAVPALTAHLEREPHRPLRLLYVERLGAIASPEAVQSLVKFSVDHADEEVRVAALEQIVRLRPPGVTEPYLRFLQDNDNRRVNRAARALAYLGDRSAIAPLIEALVTVHRQAVRSGGSSDAVSASFSKDSAGGGGSSMSSGGRTEVIHVPAQNQGVLAALTQLAGGPSFGFQQDAWRNWYALEKSHRESLAARRDANP